MSLGGMMRLALSGAALVNGVPHTVSGLRGQPFPTPFADPPGQGLSSPVVNVAWGMSNLALGAWLHRGTRWGSERIAFAVGAVGMGLLLARFFGANPRLGGRKR